MLTYAVQWLRSQSVLVRSNKLRADRLMQVLRWRICRMLTYANVC
jgi:hypothetical protein